MRTDAWVKAALGAMAICTCGGLAGMGLANFTASGSFDFYKQPRVSEWRPLEPQRTAYETGDLAFSADYRSNNRSAEPRHDMAAFTD